MVFAGQDAWRKHPLIYQCYKKPFPGLGLALGIFGCYVVLETLVKAGSGDLFLFRKPVSYIRYREAGAEGDTVPEIIKRH